MVVLPRWSFTPHDILFYLFKKKPMRSTICAVVHTCTDLNSRLVVHPIHARTGADDHAEHAGSSCAGATPGGSQR